MQLRWICFLLVSITRKKAIDKGHRSRLLGLIAVVSTDLIAMATIMLAEKEESSQKSPVY